MAGYLISGYALAVAVGAILLTVALTRVNRKTHSSHSWSSSSSARISAMAPSYEMMMIGRIVAALCHGAFFGIGSVVAASLVTPNRQAAAIAMMFAGLTSANVLGVPLGTFLGRLPGGVRPFWAISVIGIIALIGIVTLVPGRASTRPRRAASSASSGSSARPRYGGRSSSRSSATAACFGAFTYMAFTSPV
ncbi:Inner membrane transport protein ydhP [Brevibacterium casei]|uniref:Inner membrane transport protein ydhP n=1 Tax=Brevibacterium casei TaxID=33889 RepID=A0A449DBY8_9MICO|nr:MFS transporter [Brevibacterium casei]VEW15070.1 Inner membrane transport protein ydhP [Brevibacterium casei]